MIDMTSSQINDMFLFQRVIKILTAGRILQISIARCQIEAEIHSFPTRAVESDFKKSNKKSDSQGACI